MPLAIVRKALNANAYFVDFQALRTNMVPF
jgi:hypothetical protein